jgi:DNA-binding NarL/FixJ family response regulator
MRLLMVENEIMVAESMAQMLELNTQKFYSLPISVDFVDTLEAAAPIVQNDDEEQRPDYVFLDLNLAESRGYQTFEEFQQINGHCIPTIILTAIVPRHHEDIETFRKCQAISSLAGIILKTQPSNVAYQGLEQMFRGQFWAPVEVRLAIGANRPPPPPSPLQAWRLARHQWIVANKLCEGMSSKVIADDLGRNYDHVRAVCSSVYRALGVHNRVAAVIMIEKARRSDPTLGRL